MLVNLVCPPPSLSSKPVTVLQGQNAHSIQVPNGPVSEGRERNVDKTITERTVLLASQDPNYNGERNGIVAQFVPPRSSQVAALYYTQTLVGDRRILVGPREGCATLVAYMEQGYQQTFESVQENTCIKVLLHLLHPRTLIYPSNMDYIFALACCVLGLDKDDTISYIFTKIQVRVLC